MYWIVTAINLFLAMYALWMFMSLAWHYIIAPKMSMYVYLSIVALLYMIAVQIYTLYNPIGMWKLKMGTFIWAASKMYLAWALRFSSIKK